MKKNKKICNYNKLVVMNNNNINYIIKKMIFKCNKILMHQIEINLYQLIKIKLINKAIIKLNLLNSRIIKLFQ